VAVLMRLFVRLRECLCVILGVVSWPGAAPAATNDAASVAAWYWYHCAGSAALTGNKNLPTLNKVFALPSAAAVRTLALERISGMVAAGLNLGTNASTAGLLEPLLNDVLEAESLGSFGGTAAASRNFLVAVRLEAARAQLWHDNLDKAFGAAGEKFTADAGDGWRWKGGGAESFWIVPAHGWLLAGRGDEFLPLRAECLREMSQGRRPVPSLQGNWLEADLDWTRPEACAPDWARLLKPARLKISVASEEDNLRMTAQVVFPEGMPWKSDPWRVPTNHIGSPLISFTAGQDVAAFLNLSPAFSRLDGDPLTNQFCAWALEQLPFLTYMTWPVADATNAVEKLSNEALSAFGSELKDFNGTELAWEPDQRRLVLSNLRIITPSLQAVQDKTGDFLLASLFPLPPSHRQSSDEVWKDVIGRNDLVYYDWEQTIPRLQHWRMLGRMLLSRSRPPTKYVMKARSLEDKWLGEWASLTASTVTEVTRTAPNELSVVRDAPLGFTGIEWFLLTDWLSTAGAPPISARPSAR
jgi:hypothetical protein